MKFAALDWYERTFLRVRLLSSPLQIPDSPSSSAEEILEFVLKMLAIVVMYMYFLLLIIIYHINILIIATNENFLVKLACC